MGVFLALSSLLTACQVPSSDSKLVTLEDARQIAVTFEQQSADVPPRSIDDVLALLDRRTASPTVLAMRRKANEPAPTSGFSSTLAEFYFDRSKAASVSGMERQALSDARQAYDYAVKAFGVGGADYHNKRTYVFQLAWLEAYAGDPQRGIALLRAAAKRDAGDNGALVSDYGNLASMLTGAGYLDEAAMTLVQMRAAAAAAANRTIWIRRWLEWAPGKYYGAAGDARLAERHFRQLLALRGSAIIDQDSDYWIRHNLAAALLNAGDPVAAEGEAREAIRENVRDTGTTSVQTADSISLLADTLAAQGRLSDANILLDRSLALLREAGLDDTAPRVQEDKLSIAELLAAQHRWSDARSMYESVVASLSPGASSVASKLNRSAYPMVLIQTGAPALALKVAEERYQEIAANAGGSTFAAVETQLYQAIALGELGQRTQALDLFREHLPEWVEQLRQTAQRGVLSASGARRLDLFVDYYLKYLSEAGGEANAATAFDVADLARSHSVQAALAAGAARAALSDSDPTDTELADLARREQDTQQQLAALYGLLASRGADPVANAELRARIDQLRAAHTTLHAEIARRFPDYDQLTDPKPATVEAVRAKLGLNEAMIALFVGDSRSYVWALSKTGPLAFASVPLGSAELARAVGVLRSALNPNASRLGDIPPFDVVAAHALYRQLLQPVAAGWQRADSLVVVPHGPLAQLPFALLPTRAVTVDPNARPLFTSYQGVPWLVREHAIANVPSVTAYMALAAAPAGRPDRQPLVAFGDPLFASSQPQPAPPATVAVADPALEARGLPVALRASPATRSLNRARLPMLPPLPDTADEVQQIAQSLHADPADSVFTGAAASEAQVKSMPLADRRVLVFATHGLVPGDLDGLTQPALALAAPAPGSQDDGLLTLGEVLGLKLDADWVVLSACNSAAAEGEGAEAISGLGRAFFYAGARALLVSHWPVESRSARLLTTGTFQQQSEHGNLGKAAALQRAMLAVMDGPGLTVGGKTVASYAHPIFWAPFSLVGDGR